MCYLTVAEVSNKIGLNKHTIQNMCEKGRFQKAYQNEKGDWLIPQGNFITTREQDRAAEEILRKIDIRNQEGIPNTSVEYVDAQIVSDYYDVDLVKVISWINQRYLTGKKLGEQSGKYLVHKEEFEYLKSKADTDATEEEIKKLLATDYIDD